MMCIEVGLFGSILFGTLCASWTCMSISFTKLGKFSFLTFSNRFPVSCPFFSPSGTLIMHILEYLKLSQRLLILSSYFGFFFPFVVLIGCFCFLVFQIIYLIIGFIHCKLFFISISVSFISDWIFFYAAEASLNSLSILITSVLNSASDRLLISISLTSFSGVLICSFIWAMFLCLLVLVASLCVFLCIR